MSSSQSTSENLRCSGGRCKLNMSRFKCPHVAVMWKLEQRNLNAGVILVPLPLFKSTRSFANSSRGALKCDVNLTRSHSTDSASFWGSLVTFQLD
ncbi:hypothetical protein TNCV_354431 [Trichonephila clavipes]|uniref:Uncharacterized protein n=1 Tax=Trichonephila clavipes TaxID=2585209 RepID=A0A8X6W1J0_TRICX|nr:hypothetical protein TNCV_354431 [Trichonephila clavipes]